MTKILEKGRPKANIESLRENLLNGTEIVKFSMNVPKELHRAFRKKAFLDEKDMKDILLEAMRKYVNM